MKKRDKKMVLHRETLRRLEEQEVSRAVQGGAAQALGVITSCIEPNCCGSETLGTN